MAAQHDFTMFRGAHGVENNSNGLVVSFAEEDQITPIDLTGVVVGFRAFIPNRGRTLLSKTSSNGGILVNAAAGSIQVPLSPADKIPFVESGAEYELTFSRSGVVTVEMTGRITVKGRS